MSAPASIRFTPQTFAMVVNLRAACDVFVARFALAESASAASGAAAKPRIEISDSGGIRNGGGIAIAKPQAEAAAAAAFSQALGSQAAAGLANIIKIARELDASAMGPSG